jgi:hypothetical protein
MAKKMTYAERMREKQIKKASDKVAEGSGNANEWVPAVGTYRVRVVPPVNFTKDTYNSKGELVGKKGEEDDFFYITHSYHFFEGIGPEGKGKLLWTPKYFEIDGKRVKDPVDEAVAQMYEIARANKDEELKKTAGTLKRKRQFFVGVLKYSDESYEYKILKDASNEGKLVSQLCKNMGFPFYRDVQDEWVVESSLEIDEDRDVYDLVDMDAGHDFKIKKVKTGTNNWDISYDDSIPTKKSRALTEEEIELIEAERVDLRNFVTYCTYEELMEAFEEYLAVQGMDEDFSIDEKPKATKSKVAKKAVEDDDDDEEEVKPSKSAKNSKASKVTKKKVDDEDDDDFDEDMLKDLEDDED